MTFQRQSDSNCLYGVSVHTATQIFGIGCLFVDSYNFLRVFWVLMHAQTFSLLGFFALNVMTASFVSTVFLLHGNRTRNPRFYWPFLGFQWFYVSMHAVCVVVLFVPLVLATVHGDRVLEPIGVDRSFLFVVWIASMVGGFVRFYFGIVVVDRSRKLHRESPLPLQHPMPLVLNSKV